MKEEGDRGNVPVAATLEDIIFVSDVIQKNTVDDGLNELKR